MTPSEQKTPTPRTDALKAKGIEWVPIGRMFDVETSLAAQTAEVERLRAELKQITPLKNSDIRLVRDQAIEIRDLRASITAKDEALLSLRAEISDALWTSEDGNEQKPGNAESFREDGFPKLADAFEAAEKALSTSAGSELLGTRANLCDRLGRALEGWFAAQSRQRELMRAGDFRGSEEQGTTVHRRKQELDAALAEWRKHFPEPKTQTKTQ